jgi:hypothetical protein
MLGIKKYKPHRTLGRKIQKIDLALGNKHYGSGMKNGESNNMMNHTDDGIIHNDFNSTDVQREPMKHTEYKQKNYTKDIRHSSIEKQRRKKNDDHDKEFA